MVRGLEEELVYRRLRGGASRMVRGGAGRRVRGGDGRRIRGGDSGQELEKWPWIG